MKIETTLVRSAQPIQYRDTLPNIIIHKSCYSVRTLSILLHLLYDGLHRTGEELPKTIVVQTTMKLFHYYNLAYFVDAQPLHSNTLAERA